MLKFLDLWAHRWRKRHARGDVIIVRYADDFVVGFQHRWEAESFLGELKERLRKFSLELHHTKTRLLEFGRYAVTNRQWRGEGKPETFDFLGFTHICRAQEATPSEVAGSTSMDQCGAEWVLQFLWSSQQHARDVYFLPGNPLALVAGASAP